MKIVELDATFVGHCSPDGGSMRDVPSVDGAQGVRFQCPACGAGKPQVKRPDGTGYVVGAHYILVWFKNPPRAMPAPATATPVARWDVSGLLLHEITLSPSIDCTRPGADGAPSSCGFHGWVQRGEVA